MTQKTYRNKVPFLTGHCDIEFGLMHVPLFKSWNSKVNLSGIYDFQHQISKDAIIENLTGLNMARGIENARETAEQDFEDIIETYPMMNESEDEFIGVACKYLGDGVCFC